MTQSGTSVRPAAAIDGLDVAVYTIPTEAPESDGTLTWVHTTAVVVHVRGGGEQGLGFTYGSPACAAVIRQVLSGAVSGRDLMDVSGAWSAMVAAVRNLGRPGLVLMAIAAVDTALWDLKASVLGLPLARLLCAIRDDVPVYGSGGFTSLSEVELVEQLTGWTEAGIPRVKMKVGTGWGTEPDRDLARVRRVRQALGDRPALFVDANGGYAIKQAARLGRQFEQLGVSWFEEPVSSDHLENLAALRRLLVADVAAGSTARMSPTSRPCAGPAPSMWSKPM